MYDLECVLLATLLMLAGLVLALRRLRRTRPEFLVGPAVAAGVGLRLAAIAGVSAIGLGPTLRGGDELGFVQGAREIAASDLDSSLWLPSEAHRLHEIVFAIQIRLGDFPEVALRVTQVGIAMLGLVLVLATIYDLAGPRAARIGSWVLSLEPMRAARGPARS